MPRARSFVGQMRDLVVGAAQLEAEDRLQILALEQHVVAETLGQAWRRVERRLARHVVDAAGEHVVKKLRQFGGDEHRPIVSGRVALGALRRHLCDPDLEQVPGEHLAHDGRGGHHRKRLA